MTYLDHNATTPLDPRVREAMLPWLGERWGNPSSRHARGRAAREAVEQAREQVARLVGAPASQVLFTAGGTESANLALLGAARARAPGRVAVSAVEHPCVLEATGQLVREGWQRQLLGVDGDGRLREEDLERELAAGADLVSMMWANNETGVVQDIPRLAARARQAGALVHSDAVQAAGKVAIDFAAAGLHLMSITAHKMYGPIGVGALVRDPVVPLVPLAFGGGQEQDLRPGTENVAGIVGFGRAAELAVAELEERRRHQSALRAHLEQGLTALPGVTVVAAAASRLPNTAMLLVEGVDGGELLMALDAEDIAVSAASACGTGKQQASHVIAAMGLDRGMPRGTLRVSLGIATTVADVDRLLAVLGARLAATGSGAAHVAAPA